METKVGFEAIKNKTIGEVRALKQKIENENGNKNKEFRKSKKEKM